MLTDLAHDRVRHLVVDGEEHEGVEVRPMRPIVPGLSWWRVISMNGAGAMSSQLSSIRISRGSPLATVPATMALPPSPSTVRVTSEAKVPASLVLRSLTVMPRFRARNAALIRLTRSLVAFSRMPRRAAAVSCEASWPARSPAMSTVRVLTPPRMYCAAMRPRITVRGRYGAIARDVSGVSSGALTA